MVVTKYMYTVRYHVNRPILYPICRRIARIREMARCSWSL